VLETKIQLSAGVHLVWIFQLNKYGDTSVVCTPLARTGLFYLSLATSLLDVIKEKDTHIRALQEKLDDLGGSYFPRKGRNALEEFDVEKWRDKQRKAAHDGKESGRNVFRRWGELEEDAAKDWEAVAFGLGEWNEREDEV
jgi:hypothetical protein